MSVRRWRVHIHAQFRSDLDAIVRWLADRGERAWIEILDRGIDSLVAFVSRYPAIGTVLDRQGRVELRRLLFPKGPYLAWYVVDETRRRHEVWLVRLFHARQDRPRPDASTWLQLVGA